MCFSLTESDVSSGEEEFAHVSTGVCFVLTESGVLEGRTLETAL